MYTWIRLDPPPRFLIQIANNCKDLEHVKMNKNNHGNDEPKYLSIIVTF